MKVLELEIQKISLGETKGAEKYNSECEGLFFVCSPPRARVKHTSKTQTSTCTPPRGWLGVIVSCTVTWLRVAEYSGLTGRKGTALRSVTSVLWFWVVSHTGDTNTKQKMKSVSV